MKLSPHITLHFNGQCEAAFKFYEQCFDGKIQFTLTWGASLMADQAPREWSEKLLHARITIGDAEIIGGDVQPEHYQPPKGFSILLSLEEPERADRIFRMLSENGNVLVPMQETFWALRYGMVTDKFGIPWEINCEKTGQ